MDVVEQVDVPAEPVACRQYRIVRKREIAHRGMAIALFRHGAKPLAPALGGVHPADTETINGNGLPVIDDQRCVDLLARFIALRPEVWYEDIGQD